MESKLRSIQEALELVLDVACDRRLLLLEVAVVETSVKIITTASETFL
jgi:hypothetical protein